MSAFAEWNEERDLWETDQMDLLSGLSDVFSETWPRSGTTRAGTAYGQPTSVPLTDGSESSSQLPTPRATRGGSHTETVALLPTPMLGSTSEAAHGQISGQYRTAMQEALPQHFSRRPPVATPMEQERTETAG